MKPNPLNFSQHYIGVVELRIEKAELQFLLYETQFHGITLQFNNSLVFLRYCRLTSLNCLRLKPGTLRSGQGNFVTVRFRPQKT